MKYDETSDDGHLDTARAVTDNEIICACILYCVMEINVTF
jgi:hypothetical protein